MISSQHATTNIFRGGSMKLISKWILGIAIFCATTGTTFAIPITFDFRNNADCGSFSGFNQSCNSDGVSMSVSSIGGGMNNNSNGIGVNNPPAADAIGLSEELKFVFAPNTAVFLSSLIFEKNSTGPDAGAGSFDLFIDNVFSGTISWAAGAGNAQVLEMFSGTPSGMELRVVGKSGAFRLSTLNVQVPEPFILTLMGFGLAGIYWRMKKAV